MGEFIKQMDTSFLSDAAYRQYRYDEIDARTGELILEGFTYSGNVYSFSANAQSNLLGTVIKKDVLTYPFSWNSKDDSVTLQIADAAEMDLFFMTALASKKAHQDSGSLVKGQIRDAVDRAAMEAIVDAR